MIEGLNLIDSVDSDLFVPDIYATQPEFGYYLAYDYYNGSLSLNTHQSKTLLKQDRNDFRTFLNPDNIRDFIEYYENRQYVLIMNRFELTSYE